MDSIEASLEAYERAKVEWDTFENDDSRFIFPRKNYKYVSRIVANDGNAPESIERALVYFDRQGNWLIRAEAYRHLAKQLGNTERAMLALTVYEFVSDELPGLTLEPELHGKVDNFGSQRLDQGIAMLNWAAATEASNELISRHRKFMTDIFPAMVADMRVEYTDTAQFMTFWQQEFEVLLNPEEFCAKNEIAEGRFTEIEKMGYITCKACHAGFMPFAGKWKPVIDKPCLGESA